MKTCIVTGGLGFIGTNFIKYILSVRKDIYIINIDSITYAANPENIAGDTPGYKFYKVDIADKNKLSDIFTSRSIDYVINFAAESHVDRSIMNPSIFIKTNIEGTLNLLELSLEHSVSRFLQISTDEVYGSLGERGRFSEITPLSPRSPYSASKASADMLVLAFFHTYNMSVLITRCSNNYGPYQFPEKLIPLTIINAMTDKEIPLYGDGKNVRDWIYVDDHVKGILAVLEKGEIGQVYNIGANTEMKNIDIITMILKKLNKPVSLIKYVKDRQGHDRRYAMDFTKIKENLKFYPEEEIEKGLDLTINWYIANEKWWKRIVSGEYKDYYNKMYGGISE
jgi:dTDP-glucose 4,6-dehydratase